MQKNVHHDTCLIPKINLNTAENGRGVPSVNQTGKAWGNPVPPAANAPPPKKGCWSYLVSKFVSI